MKRTEPFTCILREPVSLCGQETLEDLLAADDVDERLKASLRLWHDLPDTEAGSEDAEANREHVPHTTEDCSRLDG